MIRLGRSEEEFQELYRAQWGRVRRVLFGMTGNGSVADELTQESFLKAWKGLSTFGLKSSLKTWVFSVAINVGRDWLRSHKLRLAYAPEEAEENASPETWAINEALLELEPDGREVLVLFYFEGMKVNEIAEVLRIPEGTTKSRLHTARTRLRELLLAKGHDV